MQITIAGGDTNETVGSSRKVARDVDIENFTVLDQVTIIVWLKIDDISISLLGW